MKKISVGLAVFIVSMLGACGDPEPLEVSDENCMFAFRLQWAEENRSKEQPEGWAVIFQWAEENNLSREQMEEFRSKCLRQGYERFERSEGRVW